MASPLTAKLIGAEQAIAGLQQFSKGVRRKRMKIALDAGAGLLRDEAARRAPKDSGTLKRNLSVRTSLSKNELRAYSRIGAKRRVRIAVAVSAKGKTIKIATFRTAKDGTVSIKRNKRFAKFAGRSMAYRVPSRYLHLVEGGTNSHTVVAKKAKVLARGGTVFGRSVTVAAKPKPILAPTARSKGPVASARTVRKLQEGIEIERKAALARANARARRAAGV